MKIIITGGKGQLGRALQVVLTEHELVIVDLPEIDITNKNVLRRCFDEVRADYVIHAAALTDVEAAAKNPTLAHKINGLGTQNVALCCREFGAELVHLSTNEVFSGDQRCGYEEWMPLNPINPYGRSKAAAEFFVREIMPQSIIVRTAWLYSADGRNFIHAILNQARSAGKIQVVTDEIGNPTYAKDLVKALKQLIEMRQYGTYHLVNEGACSRWKFANEILRLAQLEDVSNVPILSRDYQRASTPPLFGALQNVAAASLGVRLRPWEEALAEYLQANG
jgi:dTDP-4-dehydrorhamnose reductase